MEINSKKNKDSLASEIEVLNIRCDRLDDDLDSHVHSFLKAVGQTLRLSNMSLETPDDARDALLRINELHAEVQKHRRTAKALKQLLGGGSLPIETQQAAYC